MNFMGMLTHWLTEAWELFALMAPWLLVGFAASAALVRGIPGSWIRRHLGQPGWRTPFKASLIGIPLPLCSCSVLPAALSLKRLGARDSAALSFLVSTPQTGVDSILLTSGVLGWPITLLKVLAALLLGWITGLLARETTATSGEEDHTLLEIKNWRAALHHAFVELPAAVATPLCWGVLLAAALPLLVDFNTLRAGWAGGPAGLFAILLISVPLYVCATASVPIAAMLVEQGFGPGAAIVLLIAGPATNLASLAVISRTYGLRNLLVLLAVVCGGSLGFAFVANHTLDLQGIVSTQHEHFELWQHGAGILLLALFLPTWFRKILSLKPGSSTPTRKGYAYSLEGLTCQGCVAKARGTLTEKGFVIETLDLHTLVLEQDCELTRLNATLGPLGFRAHAAKTRGSLEV